MLLGHSATETPANILLDEFEQILGLLSTDGIVGKLYYTSFPYKYSYTSPLPPACIRKDFNFARAQQSTGLILSELCPEWMT